MDGLDLSTLEDVDQDVFERSVSDSDGEDECMPLPECIGIDSALQDDEQNRLKLDEGRHKGAKTRSQMERELELKIMKPDSIRRQIFERSLKSSSDQVDNNNHEQLGPRADSTKTHVMNIVEKAGMVGIDKEKINEIIHEASKGSLFYRRQAQRQEEIHRSIEKMLTKVREATPMQVANAKVACDKIIKDLEKQRVFNRIIVHFDLDMFFAAVEIRDNPELAEQPIAVGGDSMVSTSNYIARRYGVRAAMPGFIAKKLCPNLKLIKPNGYKYRQASSEVFAILEQYDPELTSMSLDEAYLDLTDYVKSTLERDKLEHEEYYDTTLPKIWWTRAGEVVEEIRGAIYEQTKLTCSAGIACNALLSKISTDINKPNGQFMVEGYAREVNDFIRKTPVEKVSGIGKVSAQFLHALEIKTCGDIYEKRHFLPLVFYEINVKFYLRVALGDGSTCIKSDEQRKSKSVERTFPAVKDTLILLDKLDNICEELCNKYLKPYRIRGRTVTIKLKRNTFTTTTKSYSMLVPTNDKLVIYSAAKNLLLSEVSNEPPEISYRLLGVKLSNLADDGVTTNQLTIDSMLRNQEMSKTAEKSDTVKVYRVAEEDTNDSSGEKVDEIPADQEQGTSAEKEQAYNSSIIGVEGLDMNMTQTPPKAAKRSSDESTPSEKKPKVSMYQKFIQCNATILSQSPKVEPLQCPYCMHGYLSFAALENHVTMCTKKDK